MRMIGRRSRMVRLQAKHLINRWNSLCQDPVMTSSLASFQIRLVTSTEEMSTLVTMVAWSFHSQTVEKCLRLFYPFDIVEDKHLRAGKLIINIIIAIVRVEIRSAVFTTDSNAVHKFITLIFLVIICCIPSFKIDSCFWSTHTTPCINIASQAHCISILLIY